jgi:hypothetical protein
VAQATMAAEGTATWLEGRDDRGDGMGQRPIRPGETGGRMKIKEWKKFNRPAAGLNVTLGRYWSWAARTFLEFNQSFCVQN